MNRIKQIRFWLGIKTRFERQRDKDLRTIKTAWTEDEMNKAVDDGFNLHFVDYIPNYMKIHSKLLVFQNKETGKIRYGCDLRIHPGLYGKDKGEETYKLYSFYYPYKTTLPFAAYLLPPDIKKGEYVYLEGLIEDLIAGKWNQGDVLALYSCIAKWNGKKFIYDYNPKKAEKRFFVG